MKRHPALEPLSRDHHHALVAAQRLTRATDDSAADAAAAFAAFFEPEGRSHFALEEDLLLPVLAGHLEPDHRSIVHTLVDHVAIRRDAARVQAGAPLDVLHELGRRLAAHVRFEERELFELVEATLAEDELTALGRALEDGHL